MNKRKILIILLLVLIITGCAVKTNQEPFETIEETITMMGDLDGRLVGSDGNYKFAEQLKEFVKKYESDRLKLGVQKYEYKILDSYKLSFNSDDKKVILDETNSYIATLDEKIKNSETATFLDSNTVIEKGKKYIYLSSVGDVDNSEIPEANMFLRIINRDVYKNQQIIKIGGIATAIYIDDKVEDELNELVGAEVDVSFEPMYGKHELENIYALIKGKDSSNVTVITAHYDSLGGVEKKASKGILDNGSGVAVVLDLIKYFSEYSKAPDNDIIFAFVNSEEGMSVTGGGSERFSSMLNEKYKNVLNVNFDCLGQNDLDTIYYGFQGNVNDDFITKKLTDAFSGAYTLEKVEHYSSDNLNFANSIYMYNMEYDEKVNELIHKDDGLNNIDIENLKNISAKITEFIESICYGNADKSNEDGSKTSDKSLENNNEYSFDSSKFGEYYFFKCNHINKGPVHCESDIHFNVNKYGETVVDDIEGYFDSEKIFLYDVRGDEYRITFGVLLPDLEYDGHEIDKTYEYFDDDKPIKEILNEYELEQFCIFVVNKNAIDYFVSVNKWSAEYETSFLISKDDMLSPNYAEIKNIEIENGEMYFIMDENKKWFNRIYSTYKNDGNYYEIGIYSNSSGEEIDDDTIISFCDSLLKYSIERMK